MNQYRGRNTFFALFGLVAIALGSIKDTRAILHPQRFANASEMEIAQNFGNLCQRVTLPQGLTVHQRPSPNSPIVGNLPLNQQVTLVDPLRNTRGPAGQTWTQISFPIPGYVARGFPGNETALIDCNPGTPTVVQPSVPGMGLANPLCRQVDRRAAPRGVKVRASASTNSAEMGGVPAGNQVLLVPNYQLVPDLDNAARRNWVQITAPVPGFISAGTLVMCR